MKKLVVLTGAGMSAESGMRLPGNIKVIAKGAGEGVKELIRYI